MSLKAVHMFVIFVATMIVLAFSAWCLQQYQATRSMGMLASTVAAAALGLGLGGYGIWFARGKMGKLP